MFHVCYSCYRKLPYAKNAQTFKSAYETAPGMPKKKADIAVISLLVIAPITFWYLALRHEEASSEHLTENKGKPENRFDFTTSSSQDEQTNGVLFSVRYKF